MKYARRDLLDFEWRCTKKGFFEPEAIVTWLETELLYLHWSHAKTLHYPLGRVHLQMQQKGNATWFMVWGRSSSMDRRHAAYEQWVCMVAQDVFCTLERRGFQMEYMGGDLEWEE